MKSLNFLEFLDKRKNALINEAFSEKTINKGIELITNILNKHIDGLIPLEGIVINKVEDKKVYSKQFMVLHSKKFGKTSMFQINFINNEIYSVDFFNDLELLFNGKSKANLTIYTSGKSIAYYLPIIWTVAVKQNYDLSEKEAVTLGRSVFKSDKIKESKYYIGALEYRLFENVPTEEIDNLFKITLEALVDKDLKDYKEKKRAERDEAFYKRKDSIDDYQRYKNLDAEYHAIYDAIKGGVTTLQELKIILKHNLNISMEFDDELEKINDEFKEKTEDPKIVFKKMAAYINMVINGTNPSVILCGAPGVGKTYRVKQQLKANGYEEGKNLFTIKGKCTPRVLYSTLYNYKKKGEIVVIDDADGLVGPKAPEDCINILKGALDSTSDSEGRLVSYGIAGKILDDEGMELPKRFHYNGGIIVITNYNAGSLDTALRGRSFMQDIHFSTDDLLNIIKDLMPSLDPQHLKEKSKQKAYDYLVELSKDKEKMEISIRTFIICAKIFESCSGIDDISDDDCKAMIKEQMRLQAERRKNKY